MQLLPIEDRSYLIAKLHSVLFTNITEYDTHTMTTLSTRVVLGIIRGEYL